MDFDRGTSELARAAWLYYAEELTQGQIAEKLGVSRSTVIRLLRRAKQSGLVKISLGVATEAFEAERDLERRYGLAMARIVPVALDVAMQRRWLGQVAAEIVNAIVADGHVIALSWGTTLQAMAEALQGEPSVSGTQIVALVGGLHNASRGTNPYEVAEQVAQYFRAPARALYAPVYVGNAATAAGLRSDPGLRDVLDLTRRANLVVFSVGTVADDATMLTLGYINAAERAFLLSRGAVADIACRWIDADGAPVDLPPSIHPVSVSLDDMRAIPQRLAVAGGAAKREAIRASLRGGYVTHLVTDEAVARYLLGAD